MLEGMEKVRDTLLEMPCDVFHHFALKKSDQYIVWAEDGEGDSVEADNQKQEQSFGGYIDYFTHSERDENINRLQSLLKSAEISFSLHSVQYEEETGYIHYEWKFEVI